MGAGSPPRLAAALRGEISDERVLEAIARTPRELFVPKGLRSRAYDNTPLPIGGGQTISQPLVVARMCQVLELRADERVLDVGTGSGWHAAVLARLARVVVSVERDRSLSQTAARSLAAAGIANVQLVVGDGFAGVPDHAPYDAVNVAAAAPPEAIMTLEQQLADGGRLVAPVAGAEQRLILTRRDGERLERQWLEPVRFVPLVPGLA